MFIHSGLAKVSPQLFARLKELLDLLQASFCLCIYIFLTCRIARIAIDIL
jgi:hypothetical protein